jgi:hypothetical protein
MLRTAKQLQAEASAFAPCPQDKKAVRSWIEAAQAKSRDAVREVRNQKYAGIERTEADLRDAKAAFVAFSAVAVGWLQAHHTKLLQP